MAAKDAPLAKAIKVASPADVREAPIASGSTSATRKPNHDKIIRITFMTFSLKELFYRDAQARNKLNSLYFIIA